MRQHFSPPGRQAPGEHGRIRQSERQNYDGCRAQIHGYVGKREAKTAYHEAGHAIVGRLMPDHDPVYKVTIIPRGRALGVTMFLPEEDRYSMSAQGIRSQISSLFGGRIAEEITLGSEHVTTGASNDIERATQLARSMVTKWGLSENSALMYDEDDGEVFLGMSAGAKPKAHSPENRVRHRHRSAKDHR